MALEPNIRKEVALSQKKVNDLLSPSEDDDIDVKANLLIGTSPIGLEPGDIIVFNYAKMKDPKSGREIIVPSNLSPVRIGIVVTSLRTSTGTFLSTRNNTLLNVFLLDSLTKSFYKVVVNTLYLEEKKCDYYTRPRLLEGFLKKSNFRTLNVTYVKNIRKVIIESKIHKKKKYYGRLENLKVSRRQSPSE